MLAADSSTVPPAGSSNSASTEPPETEADSLGTGQKMRFQALRLSEERQALIRDLSK
jgi:hypothetical protein